MPRFTLQGFKSVNSEKTFYLSAAVSSRLAGQNLYVKGVCLIKKSKLVSQFGLKK